MINYFIHIAILVSVFAILAISLDLCVGHGGRLSLSHAAFYGIGAYTSAIFTTHMNANFVIGVIAGAILVALIGICISFLTAKFSEEEFTVGTLCFQMILSGIFNNWTVVTRGPLGIAQIPQPRIFGWEVDTDAKFLLLTLITLALVLIVATRIIQSPFGRVLHSIREDETFSLSAAKDVTKSRIIVFAIGAVMASIAGSIYAHYVSYIDPSSFTVLESIFIISIIIIGGAGSLGGPVIGAVILVSLPEFLRFVGIPSTAAANIRQILYGFALIVCMLWRPQGLFGRYAFGREENKPK